MRRGQLSTRQWCPSGPRWPRRQGQPRCPRSPGSGPWPRLRRNSGPWRFKTSPRPLRRRLRLRAAQCHARTTPMHLRQPGPTSRRSGRLQRRPTRQPRRARPPNATMPCAGCWDGWLWLDWRPQRPAPSCGRSMSGPCQVPRHAPRRWSTRHQVARLRCQRQHHRRLAPALQARAEAPSRWVPQQSAGTNKKAARRRLFRVSRKRLITCWRPSRQRQRQRWLRHWQQRQQRPKQRCRRQQQPTKPRQRPTKRQRPPTKWQRQPVQRQRRVLPSCRKRSGQRLRSGQPTVATCSFMSSVKSVDQRIPVWKIQQFQPKLVCSGSRPGKLEPFQAQPKIIANLGKAPINPTSSLARLAHSVAKSLQYQL